MMLSAEETDGVLCLIIKKEKHQSHSFFFVPIQSQPATHFNLYWAGNPAQYDHHWAGNPVFYKLLLLYK